MNLLYSFHAEDHMPYHLEDPPNAKTIHSMPASFVDPTHHPLVITPRSSSDLIPAHCKLGTAGASNNIRNRAGTKKLPIYLLEKGSRVTTLKILSGSDCWDERDSDTPVSAGIVG